MRQSRFSLFALLAAGAALFALAAPAGAQCGPAGCGVPSGVRYAYAPAYSVPHFTPHATARVHTTHNPLLERHGLRGTAIGTLAPADCPGGVCTVAANCGVTGCPAVGVSATGEPPTVAGSCSTGACQAARPRLFAGVRGRCR